VLVQSYVDNNQPGHEMYETNGKYGCSTQFWNSSATVAIKAVTSDCESCGACTVFLAARTLSVRTNKCIWAGLAMRKRQAPRDTAVVQMKVFRALAYLCNRHTTCRRASSRREKNQPTWFPLVHHFVRRV
jgi:hypothetical protein